MATISAKYQNCGDLVTFEDARIGQRLPCPACTKETLLVRQMTLGRWVGESLLALVSVPVGLAYLFYLVTLPFTTYSVEEFLNSIAVGCLYFMSIGALFEVQRTFKHESALMRVSLSVWGSMVGGLMGVVIGLISSWLIYWPIWQLARVIEGI
jgi:hypothetical protein